MYHTLFAFALVVLVRTLPLIRLLGPRKIFDEVIRTSATETTISAIPLLFVDYLAMGQTVAAVVEAREVYILLVVGAGGKQICQMGHSAAVL
jgi:hypothetical protein